MPLEILTIPCLSDNYAYLVHDKDSGETAVVDVPDAEPVIRALNAKGWNLTQILLTHHHPDHIQGVKMLVDAYGTPVIGAKADRHRLPHLEQAVEEGGTFAVGRQSVRVYDVSGHTVGHIAFYFPEAAAVFTADSLMTLGCGRLFEGTADMMWGSLSKMMALPPETMVYSGHEYTAANAKFALSIDPNNQALINRARDISEMRARGDATVPTSLALELATNPFLRAHLPEIKSLVGMENASDAEVFGEIRQRKDNF